MPGVDGTTTKAVGFFEAVRRELLLRNYSHKTIKAYISCLRSFVRYFHPKHPRDLTSDDVRKYLLYLIEVQGQARSLGLSQATFNH
jgi:site-specific recombinase XerD